MNRAVANHRCSARPFAWRALVVSMVAVMLTACAAPSLAPEIATERWQYLGEQRLPALVQLEGTLTISRGDATRFEGSLDLQRTDANGRLQRQTGLVRGRRTATSIDFDVMLEGVVMRHVGRAENGRHSGTWVDESGIGGSLVSGAFTLVRVP